MFVSKSLSAVMPAHSRPKDGVLPHAYVAGIHGLSGAARKTWMTGAIRAFTPVVDGLCPAMTDREIRS
jgi:hypothetical protein